ncbi:MAG TPA: hypothetical protein VN764_14220, partial [Polyangiaceae bacterium]|nr:hypothetical protein [Polyangiaceae bacterium]
MSDHLQDRRTFLSHAPGVAAASLSGTASAEATNVAGQPTVRRTQTAATRGNKSIVDIPASNAVYGESVG